MEGFIARRSVMKTRGVTLLLFSSALLIFFGLVNFVSTAYVAGELDILPTEFEEGPLGRAVYLVHSFGPMVVATLTGLIGVVFALVFRSQNARLELMERMIGEMKAVQNNER
jgi:hypothetical protein